MPITINGTGPIDGITSLNTTVSSTELGYLDGVTSALQTQINTAGGLVKITDQSVTSASGASINNCFSATYNAYRIVAFFKGSTISVGITFRFRASGSDISTTSYFYNRNGTTANSATSALLGSMGDSNNFGIWTADISTSPAYLIVAHSSAYTGSAQVNELSGLTYNGAAPDGFTIYPSTGTTTATIRVYGYRN